MDKILMLTASKIIASHFPDPPGLVEMQGHCALCGLKEDGLTGAARKKVISSKFADHDYLDISATHICKYCVTCLAGGTLRQKSILATRDSFETPDMSAFWDILINGKTETFTSGYVICVKYFTCKKHLSFKAQINYPGQKIVSVMTADGPVLVNKYADAELLRVIQDWYSIANADAKTLTTWFTKDEIRSGQISPIRINAYGNDRFREENRIIELYRGTAKLELYINILNKGEHSHG